MNINKDKNKYLIYGGLSLFAFVLIFIFSMCSPLFHSNTWADANAFLTMGNGIKHGLVPYRDLFEQKGPLLYILHAVNCILTPNQFWTIAFFEGLALTLSCIYIYKITKLYANDYIALLVSMLYPFFLLPWRLFQTGDSAEEFVLPFIFISLFIILRRFQEDFLFTKKDFFLLGCFTGIALWIKFTLLGFWIGFYFGGLVYTLFKKDWTLLKNALVWSLLGVICVSLPILAYFFINNALYELWDVYFLFNMKAYPSQTNFPFIIELLIKFFVVIGFSLYYMFINIQPTIIIIIGVLSIFRTRIFCKTTAEKMWWFSMFFFTFFVAYYGLKAYTYYFLITLPFTIFGLIALFLYVFKRFPQIEKTLYKVPIGCLLILLFIGIPLAITTQNKNYGESKLLNSNTSIQKIFAEIMHEEKPNPTLLNYGALDFGFYNAADVLPNIRYFENQNVDYIIYPNIIDGQNDAIKNKAVDFVIICEGFDSDVDYQLLEENYNLIRYEQAFGAGPGAFFKLYQVK